MTDTKKNKLNPVAVGAAGAVIGVAAGAVAMALSDKNNRKKVEKTMKDVKVWGDKKVSELKKQTSKTQKDVLDEVDDLKKDLSKDLSKKDTEVSKSDSSSSHSSAQN